MADPCAPIQAQIDELVQQKEMWQSDPDAKNGPGYIALIAELDAQIRQKRLELDACLSRSSTSFPIRTTYQYPPGGPTYEVVATVRVPENENKSLPIVMLLHGTSGNANDMASPAVHPGFNWDMRAAIPAIRDHGWRAFPGLTVWGHGVDPLIQVTSWQQALNDAGFRTVNYSQWGPREHLGRPVAELNALLGVIMNHEQHHGRRFSLIGHSRGGILARALVAEPSARRRFDRARIHQVITLHSPHQGTNLANVSLALGELIREYEIAGDLVLFSFLRQVHDELAAPAYRDYMIGSTYLRDLAAREPVPDIEYFTFAGNNPALTRHRLWLFTPDSALPQWHTPPFHWRTVPLELGLAPPDFKLPWGQIPPDAIPTALKIPNEMFPGRGDILVADANARLPGAPHRTNPLNHAMALWDPALQQQVISILRRAPMTAVGVEPSLLALGRPVSLTVVAEDKHTRARVAGRVRIGGQFVGSTNVAFTHTFPSQAVEGWVVADGYADTRIPFRFTTYSAGFTSAMQGVGGALV